MSNKLKSFFKKLWKVIDDKIVVPLTKLIVSLNNKFNNNGSHFEKWLSNSNVLLFVTLFLAAAIFIGVDQKTLQYSESSAEVLKDQKVTVKYNDEAYVVEGVPNTVDVTLIGSSADLYFAKQSQVGNIVVDLSNLGVGTHKVDITYSQAMPSITYSINPSTITVNIYEKVSVTKTLSIDLLNEDKLDNKLVIDSYGVDSDQVVVKGAEKNIDKVAIIKALVDVDKIVNPVVGNQVIKDVPLKAYDVDGNVVDVEIVPSKVDVNLTISSPSKEVSIKANPTGSLSFGLGISAITLSENKVTLYGKQSVLDGINYVTLDVDVSDLKENKTFKLALPNIVGVKSMSVKNVNVTVSVDKSSEKELKDVAIQYRNLGDGLSVQASSGADTTTTVTLTGVESVINAITTDNVTAYLDLKDLTAGTHEVDVKVEGTDNRITYASKVTKVTVVIKNK
jgi:YbbR domain-containing protein